MAPLIGINLSSFSKPEQMIQLLHGYIEDGFDCVEIRLDQLPLIIEGEISHPWLEYLRSIIAELPLTFSAHIGRGLNLRSPDYTLHQQVLFSSIEICKELHFNPLVLHYEIQSKNSKIEKQFFDAHLNAAQFAEKRGVLLCVENIEVELVRPVIDLVDHINHPSLRMTFDTGHAFLASHYFHFDFLEAVREALPYIGHVHLSDNTGSFEELRLHNRSLYDTLPMGYRREFGRGDIHLPPYFGKIPFDDIFGILKGYQGKYICEYTSDIFSPFNASIRTNVREKILP